MILTDKFYKQLVDLSCWGSCAVRFKQLVGKLQSKDFRELYFGLHLDGGFKDVGRQLTVSCTFCTIYGLNGSCTGSDGTNIHEPCPFGIEFTKCPDLSSTWKKINIIAEYLFTIEIDGSTSFEMIRNVAKILNFEIHVHPSETQMTLSKRNYWETFEEANFIKYCCYFLYDTFQNIISIAEKHVLAISNEIHNDLIKA